MRIQGTLACLDVNIQQPDAQLLLRFFKETRNDCAIFSTANSFNIEAQKFPGRRKCNQIYRTLLDEWLVHITVLGQQPVGGNQFRSFTVPNSTIWSHLVLDPLG